MDNVSLRKFANAIPAGLVMIVAWLFALLAYDSLKNNLIDVFRLYFTPTPQLFFPSAKIMDSVKRLTFATVHRIGPVALTAVNIASRIESVACVVD
jgi:hypothetical protein